MSLSSNRITTLVTVITSLVCSQTMFFMFDDPGGPNLLIVAVAAAVIYVVSLALYSFFSRNDHSHQSSLTTFTYYKELLVVIFIQMTISFILYTCLN